jgi:hypothetical protein
MSIDNFVEALSKESNYTTTENGAVALKSTSSSLLDLFGQIGALRSRSETEIEDLFIKAFCEDKLLATKMAFYSRNVRGGLGEKRTFKIILKFMAIHYPEILRRNLSYISHFGRWDDLYELIGTPLEKNMWTIFKAQLHEDMVDSSFNRPISLLAKWLKSINTSSTESSNLGKLTAKKLGLSEKEYRKVLSRLRRYINVVERKIKKLKLKYMAQVHNIFIQNTARRTFCDLKM